MEHMSMTLRTATLFIALGFSAATIAAPRGDVAAGKAKAQQVCAACHGADGNKTLDSTYPKLAGQYADYLSKALHDYKSGKRANAIMAGFAAGLSDEDIDDLSAYFASQKGDLHDLSEIDKR
jgi:cytochrome c553